MSRTNTRNRAMAVAFAGMAALVAVAPVAAVNEVSQTLNAGIRSASIANLTLGAKNYSHSDQTSTGSMTLTADDSTGTGDGWNVTVLSSAFVYSGTEGGTNIAASNFSLASAAEPVMTAGQAIDTDTDGAGADIANGPMVPSTSPVGTLDSARKTVHANAEFGQGTYTQALGVSLTIPGQSRVGTYTGTMTVTINAGP